MRRHRGKSLRSAATPYLMPGDAIELVAAGFIGKIRVRPNARTLGIHMILVAAAAMGGALMVHMRPGGRTRVYLVLTDRRLLMFRMHPRNAYFEYAASVQRADATASIAGNGPVRLRVRFDVAPPAKGSAATIRIPSMRVTFGKLFPSSRRAGRALLSALREAGPVAPARPGAGPRSRRDVDSA